MEVAKKIRHNMKLLRGSIEDKEARIDEMFERLHEITRQQDILNLRIRDEIMNDRDPRWLPTHIIDDANAIILEISKAHGNPTYLGYIQERRPTL